MSQVKYQFEQDTFAIYPIVYNLLCNHFLQVVVGWQTKFDLLNGFSPTTGNYVTVASGYYLIVLKLVLKWAGYKVKSSYGF